MTVITINPNWRLGANVRLCICRNELLGETFAAEHFRWCRPDREAAVIIVQATYADD